ncbi:CPBP family intramembrane glutamic endopeptidase [Holzapfeliella sp. JNUCC 80]
MSKLDMTKYLKSVSVYFVLTLVVLSIATFIPGGNAYTYFLVVGAWFFGVFIYDIKSYRMFLKEQWQIFKQSKWKNIAIIIASYIILQAVVALVSPVFKSFISETENFPTFSFPIDNWLGLLMTLIVGFINLGVAFVEEIAFRYEMFYRFKHLSKVILIVLMILSSFLFGASHFYNFNGSILGTLPYAAAGIVFSLTYIVSKNVWVPIITHMLFNSISILSAILLIVFKLFAG